MAMGLRIPPLTAGIIVIAVSAVLVVKPGLNPGIDFKGGTEVTVTGVPSPSEGPANDVLSAQGSKGLEYTAVFIPTLVENIFPGKITNTKPNKLYSARELIKEDWIANYDKYDTTDVFKVNSWFPKKFRVITYIV